jgi:GNAT superfamily N-acetyltransferase
MGRIAYYVFQIKKMSYDDLSFAVRLTQESDWGLSEDDFRFMMELEPDGCFMLLEDSEKIGVATNVSFGDVAWFGNLTVDEEYRGKGAGSLLVKHSLDYLVGKKVKTVGLYAYLDKVQFYRKLGFRYDSEFLVLKGKGFESPTASSVELMRSDDLPKVIEFDAACFGASRVKSLEPILLDPDNLCYVHAEHGRVLGFAVAKVYKGIAELGPVVCSQTDGNVAVELVKAVLGRLKSVGVSTCVSAKASAIVDVLVGLGFRESFRVARMFYGPLAGTECICIAESLERG